MPCHLVCNVLGKHEITLNVTQNSLLEITPYTLKKIAAGALPQTPLVELRLPSPLADIRGERMRYRGDRRPWAYPGRSQKFSWAEARWFRRRLARRRMRRGRGVCGRGKASSRAD